MNQEQQEALKKIFEFAEIANQRGAFRIVESAELYTKITALAPLLNTDENTNDKN